MVEGLSGLAKQELALKERADQLRYPWLAPKERKDALLSSRHHRIPVFLQEKVLVHVLRRTTTYSGRVPVAGRPELQPIV